MEFRIATTFTDKRAAVHAPKVGAKYVAVPRFAATI
jgi:hypothetical protein